MIPHASQRGAYPPAAQPVQGRLRQGVPVRRRGDPSNYPRNLTPFSKSSGCSAKKHISAYNIWKLQIYFVSTVKVELKPGGRMAFVVPAEMIMLRIRPELLDRLQGDTLRIDIVPTEQRRRRDD